MTRVLYVVPFTAYPGPRTLLCSLLRYDLLVIVLHLLVIPGVLNTFCC